MKNSGAAISSPEFSKLLSIILILSITAIFATIQKWSSVKNYICNNPEVLVFVVAFGGVAVLVVFLARCCWEKY
jgi:hypothetical protein